jgi:hypothetical protein
MQNAVMNDPLILRYAQSLVEKQLDSELYRYKSYLRQRIRHTGDFLIGLRNESNRPKASLESFFYPINFDMMVKVSKSMVSNEKKLKMGHLITHFCDILKGIANRQTDEELWGRANKIQEMYNAEWSYQVSSR